MSLGSWLRKRGYAAAWTSRKVTVADIIHDKMSELWQKGAGDGQLRDTVRARSGMIYCGLNVTTQKKEGTDEFEFRNAYKSQAGICQTICDFEESKLLCLPTEMELFISYAQGVSPRVVIWPMEIQDFLDSMVSMVTDTAQSLTPTVGDLLEILRHEAQLVLMLLPNHGLVGEPSKIRKSS